MTDSEMLKSNAVKNVDVLRKSAIELDGARPAEIEAIANIALIVLGCLIDIAEAARRQK